ncbi:MAG TPA: hypothetical protein DD412_05415 [Holosporales bacterium]|nr:hypothetical protein [Holosporales bacterium]
MLSPVFEFFEKLIEQFTWKRLVFIFGLLTLFGFCLIIYESYTGHFKLNRMRSTVELLQKSANLPSEITKTSEKHLSNTFKRIAQELEAFSSGEFTAFRLHPNVLKGTAAFAPWLFLLVIFPLVNTQDNKSISAGVLLLAVPFSIVGAFLPNFSASWINYWVYPIGHFVLLVSGLLVWQKYKKP